MATSIRGALAPVAVLVPLVGAALVAPALGEDESTMTVSQQSAALPAAAADVRVATYNIRFGQFGIGNVAADIRRTRADVVLLQEVDDRRNTGGVLQARRLARKLGMRFAYDANGTVRNGWQRGNAILSSYPISAVRRWALPRPEGTEGRGLMKAQVHLGDGRRMRVYVTHLNPGAGKLAQARMVSRRVGSPGCATVLGGDMNAGPRSAEHPALTRNLSDVWRRVGTGDGGTNKRATARIDYLFQARSRPRSSWVAPLRHSDHRAVLGDFRIRRSASC